MKHELRWSGGMSWTCAAIAVGIAIAYTPALGNGSTWSLPYTGSISSSSPLMSLTNTGSGDGLDVTGAGFGIRATGTSSSGYGVYATDPQFGVAAWGTGAGSSGVWGGSTSSTAGSFGVSGYGGYSSVYGFNPNSGLIGVQGNAAGNGTGVYGASYIGVMGKSNLAYGEGVAGYQNTPSGIGVAAYGTNGAQALYGVSDSGYGVEGESSTSLGVFGYGPIAVYGETSGAGQAEAGEFIGNVMITGNLQVNGTINKSAVGFKIDHPLDPAHKFLVHSCVESNEMMNIYRGNVILDSDGKATVIMPDWFQAENTEFSYQLTAVGQAAPGLYVSKEIENNVFDVAGGAPGMKISWQVTGARNDKYAIAHPLKIEVEKPAVDQGKYIRPEEYGQPQTKMIGYVNAPHHTLRKPRTLAHASVPTLPPAPHNMPSH